jgi:hypothetical protein
MSFFENILYYLQLGFVHVLPLGFDHILFIICLFFLNKNIKAIIVQCSIFTLAHSLSLFISISGIITISPTIIEPLISLSILITAIENIVTEQPKKWLGIIIFIFGLIHGMGFAKALNETGISKDHFITSLLSFNVGVELGQITILLLAYFAVGKWFADKKWYRKRIVYPASSLIACIAVYWTYIRLLNL